MRMPFGKFQGWPLKELSDSYLHWLLTIELREPLRAAVRREAAFVERRRVPDLLAGLEVHQ